MLGATVLRRGANTLLTLAVPVVVSLRVSSLVEGVAFSSPSYNFSLPENQPAGVMVGKVWASTESDLFDVTYGLQTHTDVFSVNASGAIVTRVKLDREQLEWFILDVEAVDTRSPPTTALAVVRSDSLHAASFQRWILFCFLSCRSRFRWRT